jgi:DNA-binding MarR family transcriptional regulator
MTNAPNTATLTGLVLEVFRLNGCLTSIGDALVAEIGLTTARWQVVGAISIQQEPAPVARIANAMGLARQSVQRIVDELKKEGIVELRSNPHHKRAKLVVLTAKGQRLNAAAMRIQEPWAVALAIGIKHSALQTTLRVLTQLRVRLEASEGHGDQS